MTMRILAIACMIAILAVPIAYGQDEPEIVTLGQSMEIAAQEGDVPAALEMARSILTAQPDDPAELSPEEQYWVGHAHMIKMAWMFDLAQERLVDEQRAAFAGAMSEWILHPHVRTISRGEEVDIEDYLVPGQTVIFDFFSPHCPTCQHIGPAIEVLSRERDDIELVKVNINRPGHEGIDGGSPVARQYEISAVPYFKIYGPDGQLRAEGDEAHALVIRWLEILQEQN